MQRDYIVEVYQNNIFAYQLDACVVVTSDKFNKQNIPFSEFGKTVFLTREKAEQALKEG